MKKRESAEGRGERVREREKGERGRCERVRGEEGERGREEEGERAPPLFLPFSLTALIF